MWDILSSTATSGRIHSMPLRLKSCKQYGSILINSATNAPILVPWCFMPTLFSAACLALGSFTHRAKRTKWPLFMPTSRPTSRASASPTLIDSRVGGCARELLTIAGSGVEERFAKRFEVSQFSKNRRVMHQFT